MQRSPPGPRRPRRGPAGSRRVPPRPPLPAATDSPEPVTLISLRGSGPMNQQPSHEITLLLDRIRQGDVEATERLLPIVYERLRAMAGALFRGQSPSHTLQPTALVHEAYLKLVDGPGGEKAAWESRAHFMPVASL